MKRVVRCVKSLKHSPPCCLPTITVIKRRQALLGVSNMCDNGARNLCCDRKKNAIVHVADACIFAQPNMSPTQEKTSVSDHVGNKPDSSCYGGKFELFFFFVRIVKHEVICMYCEASRQQRR